jgi:hypothetical protein
MIERLVEQEEIRCNFLQESRRCKNGKSYTTGTSRQKLKNEEQEARSQQ